MGTQYYLIELVCYGCTAAVMALNVLACACICGNHIFEYTHDFSRGAVTSHELHVTAKGRTFFYLGVVCEDYTHLHRA